MARERHRYWKRARRGSKTDFKSVLQDMHIFQHIVVMIMQWRIRDLREDNDRKQKEVAAHLMCDRSLHAKYEREERPLPLEYAEKLADYYNVRVDRLLGRTNRKQPYPKK